ncbi:MAG: SDR family NAD(P)-dependent oxidoreductase [Chloroflexi bacterium]|nr:SDR family NAD(P)-dependent oxidoreductase [Chloroflexota bacterium]
MNGELVGRVALVTGAPGQYGRAIARALAAAGAWVAVTYRQDFEAAKALVDAIRSDGGRALPVFGDAGEQEQAWAIVERVDLEWGPVDILVENTAEEPVAVAYLAGLVGPEMRRRGWGRILAVGPGPADLDSVIQTATAVLGRPVDDGKPAVAGLIVAGATPAAVGAAARVLCGSGSLAWCGRVLGPAEILEREAKRWE